MALAPTNPAEPLIDRIAPSAYSLKGAIRRFTGAKERQTFARLPQPSASRLEATHNEQAFSVPEFVAEVQEKPEASTVFYLAYGSNLQAAKFRGDRGIRPLAQINVLVPSLRMTFDLPGIPYAEPCFANTARRDPSGQQDLSNEKSALLAESGKEKYRKTRWRKGLVGVVYEVTPKDYAHIIATEGGGAGYQDIVVDCHPFASTDPNQPVPETPTLPPFKAHTLFAPRLPDDGQPAEPGGHVRRPDPDYAQASKRYLDIIKEGAAECGLQYEYQDYLHSLQPYTITSQRQRLGLFVLMATWFPIVMAVFALAKLVTNKKGIVPDWMARFSNATFIAVWASYDSFFKPLFGDGERTLDEDDSSDANTMQRELGLPQYEECCFQNGSDDV